MKLQGRDGEIALLDGVLDAVRLGESRSLVLRGEAGIGKTALLEHLIAAAAELHVVRATGVESELELAYAGLQQLCAPLLDRLERLRAPQRQALEIAFGLSAGAAPDRFLVGLGVLGLLTEAAVERPLLCVVDDAQWLDEASTLTLAFAARRLAADPVGLVLATRASDDELRHVAAVELAGLQDADARALLRSALPLKLDEQLRDQLIAEARGNPQALLDPPRDLPLAATLRSSAPNRRVEAGFVQRLSTLSADARRLLLVAAAEPLGEPLLLWRAAEHLAIDPAARDEVQQHELLALGERVLFGHPLIRSAVYRSASAYARREIHGALAAMTDRDTDPDRRAWHLAAAATGPDEAVAGELERSAELARARGGHAAAGAFLRRALALTAEPARRPQRALAAAAATLEAGAFEDARGLLAAARSNPLDELQQAQAEVLRGRLALFSATPGDAPALLLAAARRLETLDPGLARDSYLDAYAAALLAGRDVRGVAQAARAAALESSPSDLLLLSLATLSTDGRDAAAPLLERTTAALLEAPVSQRSVLTVLPAWLLWDDESAYTLCTRSIEAARDSGAAARLQLELGVLGVVAARRGDLPAIEAATAEAAALAEALGTGGPSYPAMLLAAFRGREDQASALMEAESPGANWLKAVFRNGLGQYHEAIDVARDASEVQPELSVSTWATLELLEAATRIGDRDVAEDAFERVLDATRIADNDAARGIEARSRALVSEGEAAERHYRDAIDRLARTRLRTELARTHLLYGEWLRRESRRAEARGQLRSAYEQFTAIGMEAFADRAWRELQATGGRLRRRDVDTRDELTPQERQIAELARDGLSNPEIGARMFLSPRTVEWHLRNVFTKLGVQSRRQLPGAMDPSPRPV